MRDLKWIDTFWPLIIPGAANAFGIFFMRQYIMSVSNELMDAAQIEGPVNSQYFGASSCQSFRPVSPAWA